MAFGGLNTVVRGLMAQQVALNTVGHNISNANTDGYSRQSVSLVASEPVTITGFYGKMQLGAGTETQSITRARDTFMDLQMWKQNTTLGYGQTQEDLAGQIEGVFNISSETGMQSVMDNFWSSWQSLGSNASDDSTRNLVLQRGTELANTIQQAATQLKDIVTSINTDLKLEVTAVNQITSDILALNQQISGSEMAGGGTANDLRDRRDLLVDQLSQYVTIQVSEDRDGNYSILSGGVSLVDGQRNAKLTTVTSMDPDYGYEVQSIQANGYDMKLTGGELKAMVDMRDDSKVGVKGYLDKLVDMSRFLLQDFNAIHRAGYGEDSSASDATVGTGRNFFGEGTAAAINYYDAKYTDPKDTVNFMSQSDWLAALKVNSELLDQTSATPGLQKIAAKTSNTQGNASGDNAIRLSQALRTNTTNLLPAGYTPTLGATASLNSFFSGVIGTLGIQSESASRLVDNQKTLVSQIESWRQSTSGVNLDEEMTDMIRFQKGYNAAARMITTMDEMLDKLINSTGTVGR